jgi:colicin import membrane protein
MKKTLSFLLVFSFLFATASSHAQQTAPVTKTDKAVKTAKSKAADQAAKEKEKADKAAAEKAAKEKMKADKTAKEAQAKAAKEKGKVVTPTAPDVKTMPAAPTVKQGVNKSADKAVGTDAKGRTIYEGPRGGRYTLSPNGNKEYIKKQ